MIDKRKQFLDLLIGGNGSGKTTLAIEIAIDYLTQNPFKRVLFVLTDDGESKFWKIEEIGLQELDTFQGVKKIIIDDPKDFEFIANNYRSYRDEQTGVRVQKEYNGLIICDDCGGLMSRRPNEILNWFKKRRQPNIDFLFLFHGLRTDVPPAFYSYINRIILFQTSDNHEETMKHLRSDKREYFEQKYLEVQRLAKDNPHAKVEIIINPLSI